MPPKKNKPGTSTPKNNDLDQSLDDNSKWQFEKKFRIFSMQLQHVKKYLSGFEDYSEISQSELRIRVDHLTRFQGFYDKMLELLVDIDGDENFEKYCSDVEDFNNEVIQIKSSLLSILISETVPKLETSSTEAVHLRRSRPKLPSLPIPSFSGNPGEWIPFKNTFVALVHDDPDLSGVVKFSYLLDRLNEETKSSLGTITLSDDGYERAWAGLLSFFDNKRKIVEHHIDALMNVPSVSKDNPKDLRKLINTCVSNLASLELSNQPLDSLSEQMIINIVVKKIDVNLRKEWEGELTTNELSSWKQLLEFLNKKCRVLDSIDFGKSQPSMQSNNTQSVKTTNKSFSDKFKFRQKSNNSSSFMNTSSPNTQGKSFYSNKNKGQYPPIERCLVCNIDEHHLFRCPKFLNLSTHDRYNKVKELHFCINCLRKSTHSVKDCSAVKCKLCQQPHHTLLHHVQPIKSNEIIDHSNHTIQHHMQPVKSNNTGSQPTASTSKDPLPSNVNHNFYVQTKCPQAQVLLPTAIILIQDQSGKFHECRALLDSGSQVNFITSEFADKLKVHRSQCYSRTVSGINQNKTTVSYELSTSIKSKVHDFEEIIDLSIIATIANHIPKFGFDISIWDIPKGVTLADPLFGVTRSIDILLGSDIFFKALRSKQMVIQDHLPVFQDTVFGWVATGKYQEQSLNFSIIEENSRSSKDDLLNESLRRLFDLEPVCEKVILSREEELCEKHFVETVYRDNSGRYVVSLPLKDVSKLGESKHQALTRFLHLERKLKMNPEFKTQYFEIIDDYKKLHHMDKIDESTDSEETVSYYMPHHAVFKPTSTTTKVRVVFDASAKTSSNVSLNDIMLTGPTVQQSCFDIALRFRRYNIAFTSDVSKMYRQVKIDKSQTPLQRILWRSNEDGPIETYELNRLTFGTRPAPYLATRTLKQIAIDEKDNFPKASPIALRDFYVDDCLSGADSLSDAIEIVHQLNEMFSRSGFELRKWCSNSQDLMEHIPIQDREAVFSNDISPVECIKTLGIAWQPNEDKFLFQIPSIETSNHLTKRLILSQLAKLYDPLGLLAPVIISAKILLQQMWKTKTDWDDIVNSDVLEQWNKFQSTLPCLNELRIDRIIVCDNPVSIELHGFSDASEAAYGACVYIRSIDYSGNISVKLVCSKSRVAPIKSISIPRLELCGALLLSRLVKTTLSALEISFNNVFLWCDSTITLAWIKTESYKLKVFIANRVNEIQDLTSSCVWKHVKTDENPADIISRGIMPDELSSASMWFDGPQFLYANIKFDNASEQNEHFDSTMFEFKPDYVNLVTTSPLVQTDIQSSEDNSIMNRDNCIKRYKKNPVKNIILLYDSYNKLIRISAYCLRFVNNCRTPKSDRRNGFLTTDELDNAMIHVVSVVQEETFYKEILCLSKKQQLPSKSQILSLNPFLDSSGLIRVGGRLRSSNLNYDVKHQILLPAKHHFTTLVFRNYHHGNFHAGPQLLVSFVRQRFWPIAAKNSAKKCVRACITCFRNKPQLMKQIMGELPSERFTPARPFQTTGLDYCGPFLIKDKRIRKSPSFKVYIAIFVCFVTKCIHIEIVSDLTSEAFIACLKRFISRRGKPHTIWSDNATTFVGAKNELKELFDFLQTEISVDSIAKFCTIEEINWKFIPPRSPNFGGLWESAVKSLKTHLKRATIDMTMSFEELNTVVIQIEGILNSRPLTVLSTDPSDPQPLTPSHFLCGTPIRSPSEPSVLNISANRLSNWQRVTQVIQSYWKRFSIEYLHSLQQRQKWKKSGPDLMVNDVVLIIDDQLPSTQWLMGIVIEIIKGPDDKIRVANIKTKNGVFKRGIAKVCKLPLEV